jgi:hypothetical protein
MPGLAVAEEVAIQTYIPLCTVQNFLKMKAWLLTLHTIFGKVQHTFHV